MKVQDEAKPYDSINVTPMLDLAYVLLVIFILMTTASVSGLKIDLPKPSNQPSTEKKETRIIQIQPDGSLMLNGAPIRLEDLEARLSSARARDPQAYYMMVVEIIDMAARLEITNVGLVTARIGT